MESYLSFWQKSFSDNQNNEALIIMQKHFWTLYLFFFLKKYDSFLFSFFSFAFFFLFLFLFFRLLYTYNTTP